MNHYSPSMTRRARDGVHVFREILSGSDFEAEVDIEIAYQIDLPVAAVTSWEGAQPQPSDGLSVTSIRARGWLVHNDERLTEIDAEIMSARYPVGGELPRHIERDILEYEGLR